MGAPGVTVGFATATDALDGTFCSLPTAASGGDCGIGDELVAHAGPSRRPLGEDPNDGNATGPDIDQACAASDSLTPSVVRLWFVGRMRVGVIVGPIITFAFRGADAGVPCTDGEACADVDRCGVLGDVEGRVVTL